MIIYILSILSIALGTTPIIGVVTEPVLSEFSSLGSQYLAASYVKFAEASGARVAPLILGSDWKSLLPSLSGILLPGGAASLNHSEYYQVAAAAVAHSLRQPASNPFPVVGHCLGFEVLALVGANLDDPSLLSLVDAENISLPLDFTAAAVESSVFGPVPEIRADLSSLPITMNNHMYAVTPDTFTRYMSRAFVSLATSTDRNGVRFVAAFESPVAPIFAFQYHPEKSLFEWNPNEAINHSSPAVRAMQYHARLLGDYARLHTPAGPDLPEEKLIYAYTPVYTANLVPSFEQSYFFN